MGRQRLILFWILQLVHPGSRDAIDAPHRCPALDHLIGAVLAARCKQASKPKAPVTNMFQMCSVLLLQRIWHWTTSSYFAGSSFACLPGEH